MANSARSVMPARGAGIHEFVGKDAGALHGAIGEILTSWPDEAAIHKVRPHVEPSDLPACTFLEDALALGSQGAEADLAQSVAALTGTLKWTYSYPPDPRWPELGRVADVLESWIDETDIDGFRMLKPS